jgi:hypothetical protein
MMKERLKEFEKHQRGIIGGGQFITAARQVDVARQSAQSVRLRDACLADRAEKERKHTLEQERSVVQQQDVEYEESLQKDQEKDRLCAENEHSKHNNTQVVCGNTGPVTRTGGIDDDTSGMDDMTNEQHKEYVRSMRLRHFQK